MLSICCIVAFGHVLDAQSAPQSTNSVKMSATEIAELKREIQQGERELKEFRSLVNDLKAASVESSNAGRRSIIDQLQKAMVTEIKQVEKRIGKDYFLRQHGEVKTRNLSESNPQGSAAVYSPHHQRLSRMQGIYIVCSRAANPAINKHQNGLPAYTQKAEEFVTLMEQELGAMRSDFAVHGESKSEAPLW